MNVFILFTVVLSAFLVMRYSSLFITQIRLYLYEDMTCIEKFIQNQKLCDIILILYNFISMIIHLWGSILLSSFVFNFTIPINT